MAKEKFFVKTLTNEKIEIEFDLNKTIGQVKQELADAKGISIDSVKLVFAGTALSNEATLTSCGISRDSTAVMLIISPRRSMAKEKFFVKTKAGMDIEFELDPDKTISQVKQAILDGRGIPCDAQKLLFLGNELKDDNATLASLKVINNSTMHLMLRNKELESLQKQNRKGSEGINSNSFATCGLKGFLAGLGLTAGYCLWSAKANSHLGTSFGSRMLEAASPRVCVGIVLFSTILGIGFACVSKDGPSI